MDHFKGFEVSCKNPVDFRKNNFLLKSRISIVLENLYLTEYFLNLDSLPQELS